MADFKTPKGAPEVPPFFEASPQAINYPNWSGHFGGGDPGGGAPDPYDMFRMSNQWTQERMQQYPGLVNMQLGMLPQITAAQLAASQQAFPQQLSQAQQASQAAFEEQMRQYRQASPEIAAQNAALMNKYAPQYADQLRSQQRLTDQQLWEQATAYNPDFYPTYHALGGRIGEGLKAGYDLGSDLEREVQQGIRASQTARGNVMGPAATAAEAYGLGHAATDLYNTRIGQAQGFLQGRTPSDLMMSMLPSFGPGGTAMGMVGQVAQPGLGYQTQQVAPTAGMAAQAAAGFLQNPIADYAAQGMQGYGQYMGAMGTYGGQQIQGQLGYNQNLIQAAEVNNAGQYNMYDKQFEQFLYDQAAQHGLYSAPGSTGGGMGGMGSMIGSGLSAVGGLASSGLFGGGAAASGIAGTGIATAGAGLGGSLAAVGGTVAAGATAAGTGIATAAAAAGSAAAICWLAREVLPEKWREFREFLFTRCPAWFRRKYIYGARRLARGLTKADKAQIRETMTRCL